SNIDSHLAEVFNSIALDGRKTAAMILSSIALLGVGTWRTQEVGAQENQKIQSCEAIYPDSNQYCEEQSRNIEGQLLADSLLAAGVLGIIFTAGAHRRRSKT